MRLTHFGQERPSFLQAVPLLIGHVLGGTIIFATLAGLAWLLGWAVSKLHAIEPFSPQILATLHGVEVGLLYLDIGLSGIVVLIGAYRFIKEIV